MPVPVISIGQMREWERATWASGLTEAEVIRRVGKCIADHVLRLTRPGDLVLVLAARGAQRAQPGLITLRTVPAVYQAIAPQLQAVMVSPWQPDTKLEGDYTAILIGPGLAAADLSDQVRMLARHLWRYSTAPVIADASALDWLRLEHAPESAI